MRKGDISIRLGESKESIDKKLGLGVAEKDEQIVTFYYYDNGSVQILYSYPEKVAQTISIDSSDWITYNDISVNTPRSVVEEKYGDTVKDIFEPIYLDKSEKVIYSETNAETSITYIFAALKVMNITIKIPI